MGDSPAIKELLAMRTTGDLSQASLWFEMKRHGILSEDFDEEAEELLLEDETLNRVWILRKLLTTLNTVDSMEFLLDKMGGTKDNKGFLKSMNA